MKKSINSNQKYFIAVAALGIVFCFLIATPLYATKNNEDPAAKRERAPVKRNQNKVKQMLKKAVKIYPDMLKRAIHVIAKENDTKEIAFIVFDDKRNLVLNYQMRKGSHERIAGLARGQYTYHVFCENSETATGSFVIK